DLQFIFVRRAPSSPPTHQSQEKNSRPVTPRTRNLMTSLCNLHSAFVTLQSSFPTHLSTRPHNGYSSAQKPPFIAVFPVSQTFRCVRRNRKLKVAVGTSIIKRRHRQRYRRSHEEATMNRLQRRLVMVFAISLASSLSRADNQTATVDPVEI